MTRRGGASGATGALIGPFSSITRREMLAAIRRRAEA